MVDPEKSIIESCSVGVHADTCEEVASQNERDHHEELTITHRHPNSYQTQAPSQELDVTALLPGLERFDQDCQYVRRKNSSPLQLKRIVVKYNTQREAKTTALTCLNLESWDRCGRYLRGFHYD